MSRLTIDNFKGSKEKERFDLLHPRMKELCEEMAFYCATNEMPFVLTETVTTDEEDKALKRVSDSHRSHRAVDIRTREWPSEFREKFIKYFSEKYADIAATNSAGEKRLMVYHDSGFGEHIHCQLNREFAIKAELT